MNQIKWGVRVLTLVTGLVIALHSQAEIYRWVDSNGKVHYSDRAKKSDQAQEVQLAPTNTMEGGDTLVQNAARREANATHAAVQPEKAPVSDPCKADLAMYRAFTEQQFTRDGRPKRFYLNNQDGSSMTEKEQDAIVSNLGESLRARGCL